MPVTLEPGDCLEVMADMEPESFDACVTDPPYHLTSIVKRFGADNAAPAKIGKTGAYARASAGFMGKRWDGGDIALRPETWAAVGRCLKPGAHLLSFGGTRTFYRMACAIEDAGFEIRDTIMWLYGTGFNKVGMLKNRHPEMFCDCPTPGNVSDEQGQILQPGLSQPGTSECRAACPRCGRIRKEWEGFGGSLKPAVEPIIVARKPFAGTVAANVLRYGTGAINVAGCAVASDGPEPNARRAKQGDIRPGYQGGFQGSARGWSGVRGRWPANVCHDGSAEVLDAFAAFGEKNSGPKTRSETARAETGKHGIYGRFNGAPDGAHFASSTGTADRFFYCAKASKAERAGSRHPTVKPILLMRWLVRLVTPPGGRVLDPFAGSGTTGVACLAEGFDAVLIEKELEYQADIAARLAFYRGEGGHRLAELARNAEAEEGERDLGLFAEIGL